MVYLKEGGVFSVGNVEKTYNRSNSFLFNFNLFFIPIVVPILVKTLVMSDMNFQASMAFVFSRP